MRNISTYFLFITIILLTLFPSPVFASKFCGDPAIDFQCLAPIYDNVLKIAISGGALSMFLMLFSGGIKWLTSSGDPKDIENAKGRITFAVFGLIIMIASWFILKFISIFTGNPLILYFTVPTP